MISKDELVTILQSLESVYKVCKGTWDDMQKEQGWSDTDKAKVLNQVVVLEELVQEYSDLVNTY